MHIRLFRDVPRFILFLLFWFLFVSTFAPKSALHDRLWSLSRVPLSEGPSISKDYYFHVPIVSHYEREYKKYAKWIKERSKSLWKSGKDRHQTDDVLQDYVSPYLTQFEAKKDGWWVSFNLARSWKHLLWEVIPEWLGGAEPKPKEDFILLRAMEKPSYLSIQELPVGYRIDFRTQREVFHGFNLNVELYTPSRSGKSELELQEDTSLQPSQISSQSCI